jgi:hypothetical protein
MLYEDSRRVRHRQRQARYEARQRAGVALYPVPLSADEIDVLIGLGWLPEGAEVDRERVGIAVAAAIRDVASRFRA